MHMVKILASILLVLGLAHSAHGQALPIDKLTPYLPTQSERQAANIASWGTLGTTMALDIKSAWDSPDRDRALRLAGERIAITAATGYLTKFLTHRMRPDGSNAQSFFSLHTAFAFSTLGGPRRSVALSMSISTAGLRVAAGKHWLTDVLVGAGVGSLTSRIR